MDRRSFVKAAGVAGIAGLAGCSGGPSGSDQTTTTESSGGNGGGDGGEETTTATETSQSGGEAAANVGMVYATGGLGDGSFNDQAQQGAIKAKEELDIAFDESQPDEVSQFKTFQQQFAQSSNPDYDLVCCIGFLQTDALKETSASYPDQDFMLVDSVVESDNVASYTFKEHEGSYLVGQLAGLLTTQDFSAGSGKTAPDKKSVGFVGGVESDLIKKFEAGYKAGVKAASSDVEVLTNYTGSFNDPAAGKEAALAMYNNGADIVYHASGNTGTGVFQAAQEQGTFAIGVDRDQSVTKSSYKDVILASMVKSVDTAVYNSIESVVNDDFKGGSIVSLGLDKKGVDIVYGQQLGSDIPGDVKDKIASSKEGIISGDISVPTNPKDV